MPTEKKPNHLITERSPYLLQHAFNPVDWYPWGEEAFEKARREDKPIFLSVGYATCHWCHVMERESFENEAIASALNSGFVCIKVDREERPDVDKVYMTALQAMGQNGGWPMSMFLTPALEPFYGGTYFPPEGRYGRQGFPQVLDLILHFWSQERPRVGESAHAVMTSLKESTVPPPPQGTASPDALDLCFRQLSETFDPIFGGFGNGPKFPRPAVFHFLLRYHARTGNAEALEMAQTTLHKMSVGGVYDHIGGGFHRYSVDGEWRVPHFEKMLYDQAQLVTAYLGLYQVTRDPYNASVAREVIEYVLRDLTDEEGGFYSAEDADSPRPEDADDEGEGAFYVWTAAEVQSLLAGDQGERDARVFCRYYGVEPGGNAPFDPQHEFTGRNILFVARSVEQVAKEFGTTGDAVRMSLLRAKKRLFEARSHRPRPLRDDKVLASWNGLMISALAQAYCVLGDQRYLDAAVRSARFLETRLLDLERGLLYRRYRAGERNVEGQLDDYAFFVQALIDLYNASGESLWLVRAQTLMDVQVRLFWDDERGGFFETSGRDPSILVRLKEQYDGAEPTGNAVSVMNLLRLAGMLDHEGWRHKAEQTLGLFSATLATQPAVMPFMAASLDFSVSAPRQIVLAGNKADPRIRAFLREAFALYIPNTILLYADGGDGQQMLAKHLPFIATVSPIDGNPAAYVCDGYACQRPTTDPSIMRKQLEDLQAASAEPSGNGGER